LAAKACQRRSSYTVPGLPAVISQSGSHEAGIVGPVCCFDFASRNLSSSLLVAFTSPHLDDARLVESMCAFLQMIEERWRSASTYRSTCSARREPN
jgi:hypothetical protein